MSICNPRTLPSFVYAVQLVFTFPQHEKGESANNRIWDVLLILVTGYLGSFFFRVTMCVCDSAYDREYQSVSSLMQSKSSSLSFESSEFLLGVKDN